MYKYLQMEESFPRGNHVETWGLLELAILWCSTQPPDSCIRLAVTKGFTVRWHDHEESIYMAYSSPGRQVQL